MDGIDNDLDFIFGAGEFDPNEVLNRDPDGQWTAEYWEGFDFDPETGIYYGDPAED